jgi:hypothetical protein
MRRCCVLYKVMSFVYQFASVAFGFEGTWGVWYHVHLASQWYYALIIEFWYGPGALRST